MVYVLLGTGFEEIEALTPLDLLRRAGISVCTVGLNGDVVFGSHQIGVQADLTMDEADWKRCDMVVLPGGLGGVASIRNCPAALEMVKNAYDGGKWIAAICAGPTVLADLGIMEGRNATCYPGCEGAMGSAHMMPEAAVVRDGRVITGTSAGCAVPFGLELIDALAGEDAARKIREQIVIR